MEENALAHAAPSRHGRRSEGESPGEMVAAADASLVVPPTNEFAIVIRYPNHNRLGPRLGCNWN